MALGNIPQKRQCVRGFSFNEILPALLGPEQLSDVHRRVLWDDGFPKKGM